MISLVQVIAIYLSLNKFVLVQTQTFKWCPVINPLDDKHLKLDFDLISGCKDEHKLDFEPAEFFFAVPNGLQNQTKIIERDICDQYFNITFKKKKQQQVPTYDQITVYSF